MSRLAEETNSRGQTVPTRHERFGRVLMTLERLQHHIWTGDVLVVDLRVRIPVSPGDESLIVIRGVASDGTPLVGFHSALGAPEAFEGALNRIANGTMKWKVDEYAQKRLGG